MLVAEINAYVLTRVVVGKNSTRPCVYKKKYLKIYFESLWIQASSGFMLRFLRNVVRTLLFVHESVRSEELHDEMNLTRGVFSQL